MPILSRHRTFVEVGFFKGLTDFHSHILPGVDDGVKILEHSLQILDYYEQLGVENVWCTPHVYEDLPNKTSFLKERFEVLSAAYSGSIKLHLAAEYMLDHEFSSRLASNDILPIGEDGDHVLVETSFFNRPENFEELLDQICAKGYFPLLAHPERYIYMGQSDYKRLKAKSIKLQLNYTSLAGFYGKIAQKKAIWMLENGMYNACGSDIHNVRYATDKSVEIAKMLIKSKWMPLLSELNHI